MKKVFVIVGSIVVVGVICFFIFLSKKSEVSEAKVVPVGSADAITSDQVKKIMTNSDWIVGQAGWSRYLEIADCIENQCVVKIMFSSPQNCPESAADDEWCEEVEMNGQIQFTNDGFNFTEGTKKDVGFCRLKDGGFKKQWLLEGSQCPSGMTQLVGHEK